MIGEVARDRAEATVWTARGAVLALAAVAAPLPAQTAFAQAPSAQTLAGTSVVNTATVRGEQAGAVSSNAVTLIVAERLDCTLAAEAAPSAAGNGVVAAVLTNTGNGREAFVVTAVGGPDGAARRVAVDDDGDGRFDPAHDHVLTGSATASLAPGGSLHLLVPVDDGAAPGVILSARAATGSGTPGTTVAGQGDGGGDAVVGPTGAAARLTLALVADRPPTIVETQSVLAADGSERPVRGAVVTYTLTARFVSASAAASLVDPIPVNTDYRPASLALDGTAIGDAGRYADRLVTVPLGAVEAGSVHRLTFKVVIQ